MGEAERELRRRRADERSRIEHAARDEAARHQQEREEFIAEVERLVPAALAGLKRAGWADGRLLKITGLIRTKEIAGWAAGGYPFHPKEGEGMRLNELYLLSDGRWSYGESDARSFAAIVRQMGDGKGPGSRRASRLPRGVIERLREMAAY